MSLHRSPEDHLDPIASARRIWDQRGVTYSGFTRPVNRRIARGVCRASTTATRTCLSQWLAFPPTSVLYGGRLVARCRDWFRPTFAAPGPMCVRSAMVTEALVVPGSVYRTGAPVTPQPQSRAGPTTTILFTDRW